MPTVERTFTVNVTPHIVLQYLRDFSHAEKWDPGTQQCTRQDDGPVSIGSTWLNVSRIAGVATKLTYRLVEMTSERLVFIGYNNTATSVDTITAHPAGAGAEVTYHADIQMHGLAKLASPAVKLIFEKIASETETRLAGVLNTLAT